MKTLFPPIDPYATYNLSVDDLHTLYVEECGNRFGLPVVFLHGGPASGCKPDHRRFFHPGRYRVVLFDQRGSGRSTPQGETRNNTTRHLIDDLEFIRRKLGIDRWLLFAGSWGATLALLYAQMHPNRVCGLILRGVFLARSRDLDWFLKHGLNCIYPEQWNRLMSCVPGSEREDFPAALHKRLYGADELAQHRVAREWDLWGNIVSLGNTGVVPVAEHSVQELIGRVRIEIHYALNRYFIRDNQLLEETDRLPDVPIHIIHGRYDLVCPVEAGYSLAQKLPEAAFEVLPNSGHIAKGDEMIDALCRSADQMLERVKH